MTAYKNSVGVLVPKIMLPRAGVDMQKWAVVACDQYTGQPEYWQAARQFIGDAPSTLDLFLPEAFLGREGEDERIASIRQNMLRFCADGILQTLPQGVILVKRQVAGNTRFGLVLALDLEEYDYSAGSQTLIRATEGTIADRIPPRLKIRQGATVELPHILVLIDDPNRTVIEPIAAHTDTLNMLYDTDLMMGGGHITGWQVNDETHIHNILAALTELASPAAFNKKYAGKAPLLFAMGDGNHSFATAKANWTKIKPTLSDNERESHPARYALVEVENVHDAGIVFEPIHRILFNVDPADAIQKVRVFLAARNTEAFITDDVRVQDGGHVLPFVSGAGNGAFFVPKPTQQLPVGTLQTALDAFLAQNPKAEIDYIHGADVVNKLARRVDALGFILPAMEKDALFPTVIYDGALPRKTFSMGEANEKRYYLEARSLI